MRRQSQSKRARLDRFISEQVGVKRSDVRLLLAAGRINLDGFPAENVNQVIDQFTRVSVDDRVIQANTAQYVMLNKPAGVVSATRDDQHRTVIELLPPTLGSELHIAGRLDLNSTGLLLLTNDGNWSRGLALPERAVRKMYRVTLEKPLTQDYVEAFASGMYFAFEGITTRPATLKIISDYVAEVGLTEGRYHQIKRMFGRFRNPVRTLHRTAIGNLVLDPALDPGQSRDLTQAELENIA